MMRKFLGLLKWVLLLGYFPVILAFVASSQRSMVCSEVRVAVRDSMEARFVSAENVRLELLKSFPDLLGAPLSSLNFEELEAHIGQHSAIRSVEVFNSGSGVVHVEVSQHAPILRVFAPEGTFYLDVEGRRIPVSDHFSARVLVASGAISKDLEPLLKLARMVEADEFLKAQMEQLYVRRNNDFVLVPRVGDHLILLGQPEDLAHKLRNLRLLYTEGLNPREWNEYRTINLKYKNQILCSRRREW